MISRAIAAGVPFAWFTRMGCVRQAKYLQVWKARMYLRAGDLAR